MRLSGACLDCYRMMGGAPSKTEELLIKALNNMADSDNLTKMQRDIVTEAAKTMWACRIMRLTYECLFFLIAIFILFTSIM